MSILLWDNFSIWRNCKKVGHLEKVKFFSGKLFSYTKVRFPTEIHASSTKKDY